MIAESTDRRWQLFEDGLLVFERPPDPTGPSRVLVSHVHLCKVPGCTCREVALRAVILDVDDEAGRVEIGDDTLARLTSNDVLNAQLDVDFGIVDPNDHEGRVPLSDDWIRYLQSQVDGELLDMLHDRWLRAKGKTSVPIDWAPRAPDELVAWGEAHSDARHDHFLDQAGRDQSFIAHDLYCVNPTCTCSKVVIAFAPVKYTDRNVGMLNVHVPDLEVVERTVTPHNADLVDRLWNAFLARHPHLAERCVSRKQRMIELAARRAAARTPVARAADRVGRNEPCPCGSGKKYKRCCGG